MKFYDRFFALSATVCFTEAFTPNTPFDLQRRTNAALKASLSYDPNAAGAKPSVASSPATSSSSGASEKWDNALKVQGGSLKTWTYASPAVDRLEVSLKTDGRPLDADIDLWQGPDNTPTKMRVYVEDGALRPFSAVIETPRGPNTVAIRNIGHLEFPISAVVVANDVESSAADLAEAPKRTVQGGASARSAAELSTSFATTTAETDGRPLNARIELLQGPNNNKQV
eukprot:CAMPEP_0178961532 /NCGR_PEP_ID=MMETSP0789-20121207/13763_1 /TAXON_ID=3005 /ORGANISM="Rhizosolenia setigera, Strain CCMP 1694" /LENGTH=226 /DNA_ID=CAMNT_0020645385 /DNA_START=289 /DNA_END=965 /DNA_ORIENTATION=-